MTATGAYTLDDFMDSLLYLDEAHAEHFTKRDLAHLCADAIHYLGILDCVACGINTSAIGEWYMVTNEIWDTYGPADGCLCIGCLENRMGRRLRPGDFQNLPLNADSTHKSERLLDRLGPPAPAPLAPAEQPPLFASDGDGDD
jgi:hypothetical protein